MIRRRTTVLAWGLWALIVAISLTELWLASVNADPTQELIDDDGLVPIFLLFSTVGAVIATKLPHNPIGWIDVAAGLTPTGAFGQQYAVYALVTNPGSLPAAEVLARLGSWTTFVGWGLTLTFTLLLFPTGRLSGPRWKPLAWLTAMVLGIMTLANAVTAGPISSIPSVTKLPQIDNPFAIAPLSAVFEALGFSTTGPAAAIGFGVVVAGCAAAAVYRLARSRGDERQQLKWFTFAVLALPVGAVGQNIFERSIPNAVFTGIFFAGAFAGPVAVGVAILRHRLYDIDLLINRTVVYGASSAAIAAAFFIGIVVLQPMLRSLTSGSELAVAASTLVSFALFQPIRRRAQDAVDRRFDRSRYDAARTLDSFADRLRDEVDLDALRADLADSVNRSWGPAHASVLAAGAR